MRETAETIIRQVEGNKELEDAALIGWASTILGRAAATGDESAARWVAEYDRLRGR